MASNTWFIELLESERATFDDSPFPLPKHQNDAFTLCCELLREDQVSLAKRSKQRRSTRVQARTLLSDIFLGVGPEVFLLCTLSTSISKIASVALKGLVPELRRWWKAASHPHGLTETAKELCEANSISSLVVPIRKRQHSDVSNITEQDSIQCKRLRSFKDPSPGSVQQHHAPNPDVTDAHFQVSDQPPEQGVSQGDHDTISNRTANQPLDSALDLKITDLLSFLQQYQASCPNLKMICPLFGVPLPTIDINLHPALGLTAKIEFSLRSSEALVKHMLASRTASVEVSQ